ncbi:MAG: hypothetical protein ACRCSF_02225 [Mycobacteriaceae bacterium]
MITRLRLKRNIAEVLILIVSVLVIIVVAFSARLLSTSLSLEERSTALHEVTELPKDSDLLVEWEPDPELQGRVLEPATRTALEAAYVRAWAALGVYQSTGSSDAVKMLFSGPARADILSNPSTLDSATWSVAHQLRVNFYALDGATVGLTDTKARLVQAVGAGSMESIISTEEQYSVVMVLEDGYWRVRHLYREAGKTSTLSHSGADSTVATGIESVPARVIEKYRVVEYRPKIIKDFLIEIDDIISDLNQIKSLGINTIRLPVPMYQEVKEPKEKIISELVLKAAEGVGIQVIPVLFDGLTDLSPAQWSRADRYLEKVMGSLGASAALVGWDVIDRPDRRTSRSTALESQAFALHALSKLRELDRRLPLTISWGSLESVYKENLRGVVDVVSLHIDSKEVDALTAAKSLYSYSGQKATSLVVSTEGSSSSWSPRPKNEKTQAKQVAEAVSAASSEKMTWISVDEFSDSLTVSSGLVRLDGSEKLAATIISGQVHVFDIDGLSVMDIVQSKFWLTSFSLGLLLALGGLLGLRKRARVKRSANVENGL